MKPKLFTLLGMIVLSFVTTQSTFATTDDGSADGFAAESKVSEGVVEVRCGKIVAIERYNENDLVFVLEKNSGESVRWQPKPTDKELLMFAYSTSSNVCECRSLTLKPKLTWIRLAKDEQKDSLGMSMSSRCFLNP